MIDLKKIIAKDTIQPLQPLIFLDFFIYIIFYQLSNIMIKDPDLRGIIWYLLIYI